MLTVFAGMRIPFYHLAGGTSLHTYLGAAVWVRSTEALYSRRGASRLGHGDGDVEVRSYDRVRTFPLLLFATL